MNKNRVFLKLSDHTYHELGALLYSSRKTYRCQQGPSNSSLGAKWLDCRESKCGRHARTHAPLSQRNRQESRAGWWLLRPQRQVEEVVHSHDHRPAGLFNLPTEHKQQRRFSHHRHATWLDRRTDGPKVQGTPQQPFKEVAACRNFNIAQCMASINYEIKIHCEPPVELEDNYHV